MAEETDILSIVLFSLFSVLVLFSNSIVIIVIIRSRELHHPTLWNIAFMAAWDLALGLHVLVFIVPSKIMNAFVYPDAYGRLTSILLLFIITQNILNILIALVDRYISICWPLKYHRLMSAKRFTLAVATGFIINILRMCILLLIREGDGVYNNVLGIFTSPGSNVATSVSGGFSLITLSIIIALLIKIHLELRKTRSNLGRQQDSSTQFTYTISLSTIVYIVCYLPVVIYVVVSLITKKKSDVTMQIGMTCILSNSLWNVFIYAATYRPFREAFLKLFCPTVFRDRARRELGVHFNRNRVAVINVEEQN